MGKTVRAAAADAVTRRMKDLGLTGQDDRWADRYVLCEHLLDPREPPAARFESIARFCRDLIAERWVKTREAREKAHPKRTYYLSMEFLIGRMLNNNIRNLAADPLIEQALRKEGWDPDQIVEQEPDAALGNGGLGRLAACFVDSLASLPYSARGYGLRYQYGIFRQAIRDGKPGGGARQLAAPARPVGDRPSRQGSVPLGATFGCAAPRSRSRRTGRRRCSASPTTGRSSGTRA